MKRKREKGQIANLTLRIEESLRARMEKFAVRNGRSLNAEIIWRLEQSITPVTLPSGSLVDMLLDQNSRILELEKQFGPGAFEKGKMLPKKENK